MMAKNLAESVLLQSIEDLWDKEQRRDCLDFFSGEGFRLCADIAGIQLTDQKKLLSLIGRSISHRQRPVGIMPGKTYLTQIQR
jgi:hypothetical protein